MTRRVGEFRELSLDFERDSGDEPEWRGGSVEVLGGHLERDFLGHLALREMRTARQGDQSEEQERQSLHARTFHF